MQEIKIFKTDFKKDSFLLIDICGTYVSENTTFGLLKSHFSLFSFKGLMIRFFTIKLSPLRILILVIEKFTGYHLLKNLLLLLINGVSTKSLEKTSIQYAKKLMKQKKYKNKEVTSFINTHITESNPIFISASLEPIVKAISSIENIPYIASKIESIDNIYTGRFSKDITRKKHIELIQKFDINLSQVKYYLVTDNYEDLEMARNSIETLFITNKSRSYLKKSFFNLPNLKIISN